MAKIHVTIMDLNQIPNRYHNFRKYKFVFKMAFQFNEQHFGEPIPLNIGKALLENNSLKHGLFEVLASALDGEAGARPHIEFDEATNTVTIMNEGHVIKPEHFRVGSGRNPWLWNEGLHCNIHQIWLRGWHQEW